MRGTHSTEPHIRVRSVAGIPAVLRCGGVGCANIDAAGGRALHDCASILIYQRPNELNEARRELRACSAQLAHLMCQAEENLAMATHERREIGIAGRHRGPFAAQQLGFDDCEESLTRGKYFVAGRATLVKREECARGNGHAIPTVRRRHFDARIHHSYALAHEFSGPPSHMFL
jgi:hypothetical protein